MLLHGLRHHPSLQHRLPRWQGWAAVLCPLLSVGLMACQPQAKETPQATARVGDLLVHSGDDTIRLVKTFRQGEPNGLFDGVVSLQRGDKGTPTLIEINAICSLPDEPGWPSYDNLYGRTVQNADQAKGRSGDTQWQVLYHFSGRVETRIKQKPGAWVDRLRDNLCRRGPFDDRPTKAQAKTAS